MKNALDPAPFTNDISTVRRSSLVDEVIIQLRQMIETRHAQPGDRLPSEAEMAKRFGVGRSTLREAIRVLAHLGLVETRSGSGTFITERHLRPVADTGNISIHDLQQTLDFRYGVEVIASQLAARHRSASQMHEIKARWAACTALGERDDYAEFARRDYEFHRAVVAASCNPLLLKAYELAAEAIQRSSHALLQLGPLQPMLHFHDSLIESIERQNAHEAETSVRQNLEDVGRRIRMFDDS